MFILYLTVEEVDREKYPGKVNTPTCARAGFIAFLLANVVVLIGQATPKDELLTLPRSSIEMKAWERTTTRT